MEPEVHIVDRYFQIVKGCFTMTNIRCENNKEIDLLAINPRTTEKFHVESRIATSRGSHLTLNGQKRGLDYFSKEKFNHSSILKRIREIFGDTNYHKILVIWSYVGDYVEYYAEKDYGIEVMFITCIIDELKASIKKRGSRDDIIRLIELITDVDEIGTTSKA